MPPSRTQQNPGTLVLFSIILFSWQSISQASFDDCLGSTLQEYEWDRIGRSTDTPEKIWQYLEHRQSNYFSKNYLPVLLALTKIPDDLRGKLLDRIDRLSLKDARKLLLELIQPESGKDSEIFTNTSKTVEGLLEKYTDLPDPSIRKLGKFPLSDPEIKVILTRVIHSYLKGLAHLKPSYLNSIYREKYIAPMIQDWWEQVARLDPDALGSILSKSKKLTSLYQSLLFEALFQSDPNGEIAIQLIQTGANTSAHLKPEVLEASWTSIVSTPLPVQNIVVLLQKHRSQDSEEFLEASIDFLSDPLNYEKDYPSAIPRVSSTSTFTINAVSALGKNWKKDPRINGTLRRIESSSVARFRDEAKTALLMRGESPLSYDSLIELLQNEKGTPLLFELIGMHAREVLQKTISTGSSTLIGAIQTNVKADGWISRILAESILGKHQREWGELANPGKVIQFIKDYEISGTMLDAAMKAYRQNPEN